MSEKKLPDWAESIKNLYEEGATDVEVMADRKWDKATFDDYYTSSPGFKKLVDMGRLMSKAWWVKQVRTNLNNRQFNGAIYALYMKNNFGWAEKQETETKSPSMMSNDEIVSLYDKIAPQIASYAKAETSGGSAGKNQTYREVVQKAAA